jgi:hypothetical protein
MYVNCSAMHDINDNIKGYGNYASVEETIDTADHVSV